MSLNPWGFCNICLTPLTSWVRNFALSALLNNDLLTEAIWTRQDKAYNRKWFLKHANLNQKIHSKIIILLTIGERPAARVWYKSKNSCNVVKSRNAGRQFVGICTVHKSSDDSSVDVPIKSNVRQLCAKRNSWLIKACWNKKSFLCHWTLAKTIFSIYCSNIITCCNSPSNARVLLLSRADLRRVQHKRNISKSCWSLKDDAIFLCLVKERFASASDTWFISLVNTDNNWTPIVQCSTDP